MASAGDRPNWWIQTGRLSPRIPSSIQWAAESTLPTRAGSAVCSASGPASVSAAFSSSSSSSSPTSISTRSGLYPSCEVNPPSCHSWTTDVYSPPLAAQDRQIVTARCCCQAWRPAAQCDPRQAILRAPLLAGRTCGRYLRVHKICGCGGLPFRAGRGDARRPKAEGPAPRAPRSGSRGRPRP